jgi:hypothetical protein
MAQICDFLMKFSYEVFRRERSHGRFKFRVLAVVYYCWRRSVSNLRPARPIVIHAEGQSNIIFSSACFDKSVKIILFFKSIL